MVYWGGTDLPAAPPADYTRLVLLPLLARMGVQAGLAIERRGYYPRGGGEIRVTLPPTRWLTPFTAEAPGAVDRIEARVHVAQLARQIAERMEAAARAALPPGMPVDATIDLCSPELAGGPGGAIVLRAQAA
ncbi:MAG: RNA 3'-phosphate cyclase, partial [Anaerolineales bacterium]|nr:RNA 3'-phosphate cyclase [Anaerolineales bacterium]